MYVTRGGEGVKKSEIFIYVIDGSPLTENSQQLTKPIYNLVSGYESHAMQNPISSWFATPTAVQHWKWLQNYPNFYQLFNLALLTM